MKHSFFSRSGTGFLVAASLSALILSGCGGKLASSDSLPSSTANAVASAKSPSAEAPSSASSNTSVASSSSLSASPTVAESSAPAESNTVDLSAYQAENFDSSRAVYQFAAHGLKCNVDREGASCWRKPVVFTGFPYEGATVGAIFKYRFEALTEGTQEMLAAFDALNPPELPPGKTIEFEGTSCTNDGTYISCEADGYHFQMNATEISPRPDNMPD